MILALRAGAASQGLRNEKTCTTIPKPRTIFKCYYYSVIQKSITKISFVGAGNIFNAILGFVFLSAVAKTLPVDQFGKYALLTSLLVSISKIIDFGTNSVFVARSITKAENIKNVFISLKLVLFLATIPISLIALASLNIFTIATFFIFLAGLIFYGINITLFAFFQKEERFKLAVLLNTLPASIKGCVAILIFLDIFRPDATTAFTVFSVAMSASALLSVFAYSEIKNFKFVLKGVSEFLYHSVFAGVSQIVANGWPAISNSIAKISKSFMDVGIFSLADKMANVFSLISISIFTVLLPRNAARKKDKLGYDIKETVLLSVGIFGMSLVAMFAAGFLVTFLFKEKYAESIPLLNILIAASSLTAVHTFMENYFYVEEKTKQLFFITLGKLVSFLLLSFILIPVLALKGLALAQLLAAVVGLVLTLWFVANKPAVAQ